MSITGSMISELRERTGSGIKDCKKALTENNGDMEKAVEFLRKKGLAAADSKTGRSTNSGRVFSYIHSNGSAGVLLELACETDFVANTEQFQELGRDLCLQVCAMNPVAVKKEDVPQEKIDAEKAIYREQMKDRLEGKKPEVQDKMLSGKLDKFLKEIALMEQSFVKDEKQTIEELVKNSIATLKENIAVKRFARFRIGEE